MRDPIEVSRLTSYIRDMRLFKDKQQSNKKATNAATFSSVIVIDGYTLRPVKKASTAFRNRTFFVTLATNKFCSFSEIHIPRVIFLICGAI